MAMNYMESSSVPATKKYLEGPKDPIDEDYGGLGAHFLEKLYEHLNKIHQIDTVTGVTETNGSVRSRAIQVAHELRHQGVVENDIIVICSRGHADQTVVVLAALLIGAIIAPLDPELHHNECLEMVKQLKPKICFCDLRPLKQIERVVHESGMTAKMVNFGDQQQYALAFRKFLAYKQQQEQFRAIHIEQPRKRVAFIVPTQGTTGKPKLVCVSHHFIYCQIHILYKGMNSPEKLISYYPLSWILQVVLVCFCLHAAVVRILTGVFSERNTCKFIHDLKVDHAFLNTDLALRLVDHVAVKVLEFILEAIEHR